MAVVSHYAVSCGDPSCTGGHHYDDAREQTHWCPVPLPARAAGRSQTCDHEDHVADGHGGGHWMRCGMRLPCPDHPWVNKTDDASPACYIDGGHDLVPFPTRSRS